MSAIEDRRAATAAVAEEIRRNSVTEAAEVASCTGMNPDNYASTATFGSQLNWISTDAHSDGSLELSVHEYDEFKISASLTREEALALRDFITATYES